MANREPETATLLTPKELLDMSNALLYASEQLSEAAQIAEQHGGLATFSYKSGQLAVDRAASFVAALQQSVFALKSGKPLKDGQLKPRSVAKSKTRSNKEIDSMAKDDLKLVELHRQSKKKKKN